MTEEVVGTVVVAPPETESGPVRLRAFASLRSPRFNSADNLNKTEEDPGEQMRPWAAKRAIRYTSLSDIANKYKNLAQEQETKRITAVTRGTRSESDLDNSSDNNDSDSGNNSTSADESKSDEESPDEDSNNNSNTDDDDDNTDDVDDGVVINHQADEPKLPWESSALINKTKPQESTPDSNLQSHSNINHSLEQNSDHNSSSNSKPTPPTATPTQLAQQLKLFQHLQQLQQQQQQNSSPPPSRQRHSALDFITNNNPINGVNRSNPNPNPSSNPNSNLSSNSNLNAKSNNNTNVTMDIAAQKQKLAEDAKRREEQRMAKKKKKRERQKVNAKGKKEQTRLNKVNEDQAKDKHVENSGSKGEGERLGEITPREGVISSEGAKEEDEEVIKEGNVSKEDEDKKEKIKVEDKEEEEGQKLRIEGNREEGI